jgi:hypothetical protein
MQHIIIFFSHPTVVEHLPSMCKALGLIPSTSDLPIEITM